MNEEKHDVIVSFTNGEAKRFHDCDKYIVAFNSHIEIGHSGNMTLVVDYDVDALRRKDICRMRFFNENTGEEITRFYLDKNAIENLTDILT